MTKRYSRSSATTAEHVADRLDNRDEDVMQGLVTAGALVALADGRVEEVERDELLNFIDRQQLAPTIPRTDIAQVFDRRVRQLQDRDSAEVIIENLRPLVGLSLASVVLRTAQRVAAADRQIHPGELRALELIRLIMTSLSAKGLPVRLRPGDTLGCKSASDTRRIQEDLAGRFSGPRIGWLYQGTTIRRLALTWRFHLRKQISLALLIAVIVGLAINFWVKSTVVVPTGADVIQPNEKLSSASNPPAPIQLDSPKVVGASDVDVIEPKDQRLPMFKPTFNPYLPFRVLEPVY